MNRPLHVCTHGCVISVNALPSTWRIQMQTFERWLNCNEQKCNVSVIHCLSCYSDYVLLFHSNQFLFIPIIVLCLSFSSLVHSRNSFAHLFLGRTVITVSSWWLCIHLTWGTNHWGYWIASYASYYHIKNAVNFHRVHSWLSVALVELQSVVPYKTWAPKAMALLHLLLFYTQQNGQVLWASLCCLLIRGAPSWDMLLALLH
jgi:hypothetical protein